MSYLEAVSRKTFRYNSKIRQMIIHVLLFLTKKPKNWPLKTLDWPFLHKVYFKAFTWISKSQFKAINKSMLFGSPSFKIINFHLFDISAGLEPNFFSVQKFRCPVGNLGPRIHIKRLNFIFSSMPAGYRSPKISLSGWNLEAPVSVYLPFTSTNAITLAHALSFLVWALSQLIGNSAKFLDITKITRDIHVLLSRTNRF